MERLLIPFLLTGAVLFVQACGEPDGDSGTAPAVFTGAPGEVVLITIDPGHFHAGLVQKVMYGQISPTAYVFAPDGSDVETHLDRIEGFNSRVDDPTAWREVVYTGPDYLERMLEARSGNVLVTSGNNRRKTGYIKAAVEAGIHVLADKPMCIDPEGFELLKETFRTAGRTGVLLYDIMTERNEITSILQRELAHDAGVFGTFMPGSPEEPSVVKESVHHLFKYVAGDPIKRPGWFFDVDQQGEGLVDITTHLVDLVMWGCFPGETIDYETDIDVMAANRWPTMVSREQFKTVTRLPEFPKYLASRTSNAGTLPCFCNGDITYRVRDLHARVSVIWNYRAPEGGGDTHYSVMRGTKSDIVIRQGADAFGSQCVVLGMDVEWVGESEGIPCGYEIVTHGGRQRTGLDALEWAQRAEAMGAGEICLNSIDADGTQAGYENRLTRLIATGVGIPVIASGGAGQPEDLVSVLTEGCADAALVASMVHFGGFRIRDLKQRLDDRGVKVRLGW